MSTLDSIVLPLAESRALAEKGIVLDTALVWAYVKDANGKIVLTVMARRDAAAACLGADCDGQKVICGAWTLSELLDAIRAKVNPTSIFFNEIDQMIVQWIEPGNVVPLQERTAHRQTDLLAAYALLLEVAK